MTAVITSRLIIPITNFEYKVINLITNNFSIANNYFREMSNCIFCKIIAGDVSSEILYQDEELVIFKDIKPAAKFHFLAVPNDHILNVNNLTKDHIQLIEKLIAAGKQVLQEKGGDVNDIRLGFHLPPFNSVSHLHLHVISPASEMSFLGRLIFKPNTWWFSSVDQIIEKIGNSKL